MKLILISAMTADRVIGSRDGLPWDLPDEYAHFLAQVAGHPVIFGRRSYDIFGADLPDSPKIVVSRSADESPGVEIARTIDEALRLARAHGHRAFSAGGASIYEQTLPHATAMYLSIVEGDHEGDTRFPAFDASEWTVTRTEDHPRWQFRVYERKGAPARRPHRGSGGSAARTP